MTYLFSNLKLHLSLLYKKHQQPNVVENLVGSVVALPNDLNNFFHFLEESKPHLPFLALRIFTGKAVEQRH